LKHGFNCTFTIERKILYVTCPGFNEVNKPTFLNLIDFKLDIEHQTSR